jgi:amino acid adenylation domain-containing protein
VHHNTESLGFKAGDLSVCAQFQRQVALYPKRTAVRLGDGSLTYAELDGVSDALANGLAERGVGHGSLVGVLLERSLEMIVSLVAILKAGAAYVPLDANYPDERLSFMAKDSGVKVVVSSERLAARVQTGLGDVLSVDLGELKKLAASGRGVREFVNVGGEQRAYVMYTSGSTGVPKGVPIPHRGIVRLVCQSNFIDIKAEDVFLHHSATCFDASTFEIWGALLNGACVALLPPGPGSLGAIAETIRREQVTVLWLTGGLFNLMVDERLADLRPVRQLLVGGETLSGPHIERALAALPDTQLINGYGPTENTTFTCCYRIPRGATFPQGVPIGPAIRGTYCRIVDESLRPLPAGEIGELVTGGLGLALGYWNRPELTIERFVDDPLQAGCKLYRTGDLARERSDGVYEYFGRRDTQVKLRGFRVELGEIEIAVKQHLGVRDCAVVVAPGDGAARSLIAFVVRRQENGPAAAELRQFLAARLPEHMVPSLWEFLPSLPLNPNGKVDRAALTAGMRHPETAAQPSVAVKNDTEGVIASHWQQILGARPFMLTDTFFDVGGDSLMVTRLHDRLCKQANLSLELTDLFRYPTVRSLASYVEQKRHAPVPVAPQNDDRGRAQRRGFERFRKN